MPSAEASAGTSSGKTTAVGNSAGSSGASGNPTASGAFVCSSPTCPDGSFPLNYGASAGDCTVVAVVSTVPVGNCAVYNCVVCPSDAAAPADTGANVDAEQGDAQEELRGIANAEAGE